MTSLVIKGTLRAMPIVLTMVPAMVVAQSPKSATYITDEEIKAVNATPGIDRTIKVVDIGNEHFAVGIIHRVAPQAGGAARGAAGAAAVAGGAGRGTAPAAEPCGETSTAPPADGTPGGITHDSQTEGYIIVSGSGTLVTGGHIVNGRKSPADSEVTKVLNGPSCSGVIAGADVVKRPVKTGDIIIIPAGVPHGWTGITDHVDYLSLRPSGQVLDPGYVHPSIKK
jgi:mannose-6-phosphate isomerase-like protein (cupin superfamily)